MAQRNEVLTREDNRISIISVGGTTMQQDYVAVTEREMPVNMIQQTWVLEPGEENCAGRKSRTLVNALVKIVGWVNRLGTGQIDESRLESRHNIHHNLRAKSIGL